MKTYTWDAWLNKCDPSYSNGWIELLKEHGWESPIIFEAEEYGEWRTAPKYSLVKQYLNSECTNYYFNGKYIAFKNKNDAIKFKLWFS